MELKSIKKNSGIYKIICRPTGKFYIGQSTNVRARLSKHRTDLRSQKHCNPYLQRAYNKYRGYFWSKPFC